MNCFRWLAALMVGWVAYGQGTVYIHNNFTPRGTAQKAFILELATGRPFPKNYCRIEVLDQSGNLLNAGNLAADGLFFLGIVKVPGTQPGENGRLIIRAWDTRWGASFDEARSQALVVVTLSSLGDGPIPPPMLGEVGDFTGMTLGVLSLPGPAQDVGMAESGPGQVLVRGNGWLGYPYRIWASTNLMGWFEAGPTRLAGPQIDTEIGSENYWRGFLEWKLDPPPISSFFRIEPIQWEPPAGP